MACEDKPSGDNVPCAVCGNDRNMPGDQVTGTQHPLPTIDACIGSEGTIILSPQVWLRHLKDGESITSPVPMPDDLLTTDEFKLAVLELQRQHGDMVRYLQDWATDVTEQHEHSNWDEVHSDCTACAYQAMLDRWEAKRVD
jgi:hypothetical protein